MPTFSFDLSFSTIKLIGTGFLAAIVGFLAFYFYWSIDRKTESFDKRCKAAVENHPAFRGIRRGARFDYIITSNSSTAKAWAVLKKFSGKWTNKPSKIVVVESQTLEERHKEIIFERCREIPGKNIIDPELVASLRNFFAYKLALKELGEKSEVAHHFKSKFEKYEFSGRVNELGKEEYYEKVTLLDGDVEGKNPLSDVFLPILQGAEDHCVSPITDFEEKKREIERCREFMMATFWGLYSQDIKGVELDGSIDKDEAADLFRIDVRDRDNIGYWVLLSGDTTDKEFKEFKYIAWKVGEILDEYWNEGNYSELYPNSKSIPEMENVQTPFLVYRKELDQFQGGPQYERIKGETKFRRKEEHQG